KAIFERNFLLRLPAVSRPTFRTLAGDAGIQPAKRADGLDGIVGSERQANAVPQHGVPGIRALDALRADAVLSPAHVRGLMRRLHRGNHFEFLEALEVRRGDHLGVLDAIAAVARAVGLENRFENVESNAIGAITYRSEERRVGKEWMTARWRNRWIDIV